MSYCGITKTTKFLLLVGVLYLMAVCILAGVTKGAEPAPARLSAAELASLVKRAQAENNVIESIEAVSTTAGAASAALNPSSGFGPNTLVTTPAVLVVMHGLFIYGEASGPPGAPAPTGKVMAFVVDPVTGFTSEVYVGDSSPTLRPLGVVEHLPVPAGSAPTVKTNAILVITVVDNHGDSFRLLRTAQVSITVRRKGYRVVAVKGDEATLRLDSGTYHLAATLREPGSQSAVHCQARSVQIQKRSVDRVELSCPLR